jgi:hypothetical protein
MTIESSQAQTGVRTRASSFALALPQLYQQLPHSTRSPQFAGNVGGEAQIALGIEPAGFDIGR